MNVAVAVQPLSVRKEKVDPALRRVGSEPDGPGPFLVDFSTGFAGVCIFFFADVLRSIQKKTWRKWGNLAEHGLYTPIITVRYRSMLIGDDRAHGSVWCLTS